MLYGLFEFALKHEWCERNPLKLVEGRKVIEKEIAPLKHTQTECLLKSAKSGNNNSCLPAIGLVLFAGIRQREVRPKMERYRFGGKLYYCTFTML